MPGWITILTLAQTTDRRVNSSVTISPLFVAIAPAPASRALPVQLAVHAARSQDWVSASPLGAASSASTTTAPTTTALSPKGSGA